MSSIRKCYNANCENNFEGAYCDGCEVVIDECGMCCSYVPKEQVCGQEQSDVSQEDTSDE